MTLDAGTVIAIISLIGVVATAWLGNRGKNAEIKASGMNDLNDALQAELRRKNEENNELSRRNEELERENRLLRSLLNGDNKREG